MVVVFVVGVVIVAVAVRYIVIFVVDWVEVGICSVL